MSTMLTVDIHVSSVSLLLWSS